jgi:hypothetical protein
MFTNEGTRTNDGFTDLLNESSSSSRSSHFLQPLCHEDFLDSSEDIFDTSSEEFTQIGKNHQEKRDSNASIDNSDDTTDFGDRSNVTVTC